MLGHIKNTELEIFVEDECFRSFGDYGNLMLTNRVMHILFDELKIFNFSN